MHGFPGDGKTAFHLRAYRNIFHILAKGIGKETIQLMAAVIPDIPTEQAGADTQFDLFHRISF
jgi:hypothetical protein